MTPWSKSKRSEYPPGTSGSRSVPNLASARQSSGEQMPQQPAQPTPASSRTSHFLAIVKRPLRPSRSPCPSQSPGIGRRSDTKAEGPTATSIPQSPTAPANAAARLHSSYSGGSTLQTLDPSLTGEDNVTTVSTGNHSSPSSSYL